MRSITTLVRSGASVVFVGLALACAQTPSSAPAQLAPPAASAQHTAPTQSTPSTLDAEPARAALPALVPAITARELEAHVRFLASDELKGRSTGTPEARRAAEYLAEVLRASGIAPAGDDGTFFQRVPLERVRSSAAAELLVTPQRGDAFRAESGTDFRGQATLERATAALRIVHAKLIADVPKTPDPGAALFLDMSQSDRRRALKEAGEGAAAGWGLILTPARERANSARTASSPEAGATPWSRPRPKRTRERSDAVLELGGTLLERVRAGEIATLQLTTHIERADIDAVNVVGVLRGAANVATPELAAEAVVLSAHYDHLPPLENGAAGADTIFNGADDDASGCAAVLELAGALAHAGPPARTVVFLLATGEEIGLLGTEVYLDHPAVPLAQTVANLNFEMIGRPDTKVGGAGVLWLTGFERTNLGPAFAAAGLPLKADPRPNEHFYERSDNYAFVKRGVIGQSFSSYDAEKHGDYHTVRDDADHIDFAHLEACVRASATCVTLVTRGELRPAWTPVPDAETKRGTPASGEMPR